jgi:hypothetical protein
MYVVLGFSKINFTESLSVQSYQSLATYNLKGTGTVRYIWYVPGTVLYLPFIGTDFIKFLLPVIEWRQEGGL